MTGSFRMHGPHGIVELAAEDLAERAPAGRPRTIADQVPVTEIMSRHVVCAFPDLPLAAVVEVMMRERLGCVPIVDHRGRPLGMVTKLDLVEQLVEPSARAAPRIDEVMMPFAITLDDNATVAHAAAIMASEDMHHVMIVSDRRLVGVVSTMDVTRWLFDNDGLPA